MRKINLILASSDELKEERQLFEIEIYRKCKSSFDKGIFLHLDIWEDLSARMSKTRSQDEYNKVIVQSDIFVLLAFSKVYLYTSEEFEVAFGNFQTSKKPFIYTYFKSGAIATRENREQLNSLFQFQDKLVKLGHFYANYKDFNDLWVQFNKELDRLLKNGFSEAETQQKNEEDQPSSVNNIAINNIEKMSGGTINSAGQIHQYFPENDKPVD